MILNTHYAYGAGVSGAVIVVTAPTGSTVTASLDGVVYTAQEVNGTWTFKVRKFGTYTINATLADQTASTTVNVTEATTYEVTLAYVFTVRITTPEGTVYNSASVTMNGVKYTTQKTLQVNTGTIITLSAKGTNSTNPGLIYVNKVKVKQGKDVSYDITPDKDTNIKLTYSTGGQFGMVHANY